MGHGFGFRGALPLPFKLNPVVDSVVQERPGEQDKTVVQQRSERNRDGSDRNISTDRHAGIDLKQQALDFPPDGGTSEREQKNEQSGGQRSSGSRPNSPVQRPENENHPKTAN